MSIFDETEFLRLVIRGARAEGKDAARLIIDGMQATINGQEAELIALRKQRDSAETSRATGNVECERLAARIAGLETENDRLAAELAKPRAGSVQRIAEMEAENERLVNELAKLHGYLRQHIKALGAAPYETMSKAIERLQVDARLGRLVRAMPLHYKLVYSDRRTGVPVWECWNSFGELYGYTTPEDALLAAGITDPGAEPASHEEGL